MARKSLPLVINAALSRDPTTLISFNSRRVIACCRPLLPSFTSPPFKTLRDETMQELWIAASTGIFKLCGSAFLNETFLVEFFRPARRKKMIKGGKYLLAPCSLSFLCLLFVCDDVLYIKMYLFPKSDFIE